MLILPRRVNSLPPCRLTSDQCEPDYFHWSLLATLSLHYFISRRELGLSKIPFTDINKRRSSKAAVLIFNKTWLQKCLQLQHASCNSCYFSFQLKGRCPLPHACTIYHLHASALLLVFYLIPAYVSALATLSWCLCQLKAFEGIGALIYLGSLLMFLSQILHLSASCSPSTDIELIPEVICQLTLYPVLHLYI